MTNKLVLPSLPFDVRAAREFVYTERNVVGPRSRLGRLYSKLGEQTEHFLRPKTQDQLDRLAIQMAETHKDIKKLTRVRVAAPTLPKGEF